MCKQDGKWSVAKKLRNSLEAFFKNKIVKRIKILYNTLVHKTKKANLSKAERLAVHRFICFVLCFRAVNEMTWRNFAHAHIFAFFIVML